MKATPSVKKYYCDNCDSRYHAYDEGNPQWKEGTAWYCSDRVSGGDEYYMEASEEDVWWCYGGCFHHDDGSRPVIYLEWVCTGCRSGYDDKEDAENCC